MWELLSPPDSDLPVTIAGWTTVVAGAMTIVLFCCTLLLRHATNAAALRRARVIERWRGVFAAATLSAPYARGHTLPRYSRRERSDLLEEWNRARESVEGEAVGNLIVVGERLGLDALARRMLRRRQVSARLAALQTIGNLGDRSQWPRLLELLGDRNTALSMTAAAALVEIDAREALPFVMPCVIERTDWPPATVSRLLTTAGPDLVTQPLCRAILTADAQTSVRLLKYAALASTERIDQLVEMLLRERQEPAVLAAALKAASNGAVPPRLERLAGHDAWYVRMQAARLLGRIGQERDLPLLERLLKDAEWWVRYRAAQAIVSLPFLGPNRLRALCTGQADPFAADMLRQAMAEVGLG